MAGPDPRVERSRALIRRAALEELGAVGYGAFSIESVAARARVGKSTIYRHWRGKADLVVDAFSELNVQPRPTAIGTGGRDRVEELLRHVAEAVTEAPFSACIPALVEAAERDPELRELHHRYNDTRRAALVDAVAEAVAAGEARPGTDPELAALALVGPIFYRRLMTAAPFEAARVGALVDLVLGPTAVPRASSSIT